MTSNLCVAQSGSAPTLGVGGRWFESSRIDQQEDEPSRAGRRLESGWSRKAWASIAPVFRHLTRRSSVAEQRTHNPFVAGSTPAAATHTPREDVDVARVAFIPATESDAMPTPGRFARLENREEVIAKPGTFTSLTVAKTVFAGASCPGISYSALAGGAIPASMICLRLAAGCEHHQGVNHHERYKPFSWRQDAGRYVSVIFGESSGEHQVEPGGTESETIPPA